MRVDGKSSKARKVIPLKEIERGEWLGDPMINRIRVWLAFLMMHSMKWEEFHKGCNPHGRLEEKYRYYFWLHKFIERRCWELILENKELRKGLTR